MQQLNVGGDYNQLLRRMEPKQYLRNPRPGTFEIAQPFTAPPLNTDIRFSSVLPQKHLTESQYLTVATVPLPETWDWRHEYPEDDQSTKTKKKHMTKVPNQGLCGSCWAVAVAGLISDLFVASGLSPKNPDVSITYSLSCYPQYKCGGGNPATLLEDIQRDGIASNECIDYGWCNNDSVCSGKGSQHFNPSTETERINSLIPPCGCYSGSSKKQPVYYVKNPSVVTMENDNHDVAPLIKTHIYSIGPVIGGYHVFTNFMSGDYTATGGVYFEQYDYDTDRWLSPGESPQWAGSHAIVVIGWGVSEQLINVPLPDGRPRELHVPYWYCRNSWGSEWGIDNGYFKIAMYPFNQQSQFERVVVIRPQNMMSGGFMLCYPDSVEQTDEIEQVVHKRVFKEEYMLYEPCDPRVVWTFLSVIILVLIFIAIYFRLKPRI